MSEQITFATSDFASNPEPRCPCILLLDVSSSMSGRPINELNAGLVTFRDELLADSLALKRVEVDDGKRAGCSRPSYASVRTAIRASQHLPLPLQVPGASAYRTPP